MPDRRISVHPDRVGYFFLVFDESLRALRLPNRARRWTDGGLLRDYVGGVHVSSVAV